MINLTKIIMSIFGYKEIEKDTYILKKNFGGDQNSRRS